MEYVSTLFFTLYRAIAGLADLDRIGTSIASGLLGRSP
jgi:hypothetical protein